MNNNFINSVKLLDGKCIDVYKRDKILEELNKVFDLKTSIQIYDFISISDYDIKKYVIDNSEKLNFLYSDDIKDSITDTLNKIKSSIETTKDINTMIKNIMDDANELDITKDSNILKENISNSLEELNSKIPHLSIPENAYDDIEYVIKLLESSIIIRKTHE